MLTIVIHKVAGRVVWVELDQTRTEVPHLNKTCGDKNVDCITKSQGRNSMKTDLSDVVVICATPNPWQRPQQFINSLVDLCVCEGLYEQPQFKLSDN